MQLGVWDAQIMGVVRCFTEQLNSYTLPWVTSGICQITHALMYTLLASSFVIPLYVYSDVFIQNKKLSPLNKKFSLSCTNLHERNRNFHCQLLTTQKFQGHIYLICWAYVVSCRQLEPCHATSLMCWMLIRCIMIVVPH